MNSEVYERLAERTMNTILDAPDTMLNATLGLSGESGEIADHVKKHLYHGHVLDRQHIILELGDLQWYIMQMCYALDTTLDEVMTQNIAKLEKRYKNGFNHAASINREDQKLND